MDLALWNAANMAPVGALQVNQSALQQGMFGPDWDALAASHRQQRRQHFERDTSYAEGGGAAAVAWNGQPGYRTGDLPMTPLGGGGVQGPALVMNDSAARQIADPFLSQPSQPAGKRMLRWLRLLFHNLLQLLLRRARTADPEVSEVDVASLMDEAEATDVAPLPTIGSALLLAAATFAESGLVPSTPIPTSPVAVPRRRR